MLYDENIIRCVMEVTAWVSGPFECNEGMKRLYTLFWTKWKKYNVDMQIFFKKQFFFNILV